MHISLTVVAIIGSDFACFSWNSYHWLKYACFTWNSCSLLRLCSFQLSYSQLALTLHISTREVTLFLERVAIEMVGVCLDCKWLSWNRSIWPGIWVWDEIVTFVSGSVLFSWKNSIGQKLCTLPSQKIELGLEYICFIWDGRSLLGLCVVQLK